MTARQHAKATVALVAIALNLLVWCVPLLLLFPFKLLVPPMRPWFARRAADVYRAAVTVDDCPSVTGSGDSPSVTVGSASSSVTSTDTEAALKPS